MVGGGWIVEWCPKHPSKKEFWRDGMCYQQLKQERRMLAEISCTSFVWMEQKSCKISGNSENRSKAVQSCLSLMPDSTQTCHSPPPQIKGNLLLIFFQATQSWTPSSKSTLALCDQKPLPPLLHSLKCTPADQQVTDQLEGPLNLTGGKRVGQLPVSLLEAVLSLLPASWKWAEAWQIRGSPAATCGLETLIPNSVFQNEYSTLDIIFFIVDIRVYISSSILLAPHISEVRASQTLWYLKRNVSDWHSAIGQKLYHSLEFTILV